MQAGRCNYCRWQYVASKYGETKRPCDDRLDAARQRGRKPQIGCTTAQGPDLRASLTSGSGCSVHVALRWKDGAVLRGQLAPYSTDRSVSRGCPALPSLKCGRQVHCKRMRQSVRQMRRTGSKRQAWQKRLPADWKLAPVCCVPGR